MTTSAPQPQHPSAPDAFAAEPTRVPWLAVTVFAVIAVGLAWLVTLPMWLGDGLADPLFQLYALGMMYTPAVAAVIVTFFIVKPPYRARYLGLTPFKPVWRSIVLILVWPLVFGLLSFAGVWLASVLGWVDFGLNLAAYDEAAEIAGLSSEAIAVISLVSLPLVVVQATFAAFGEELGWRGFLVSALRPLGFWPMALISGLLWGVWHAPLILLGYNFGRTDVVGVLMMVGFCFFVGVLLNWARMWCRNMWVAAVGHGALNATATIGFLFIAGDPAALDAFWHTALGLPGWIIMAVLIAVMAALGLFGRRLPQPLVTVPAKVLRADAGRANPLLTAFLVAPIAEAWIIPFARSAEGSRVLEPLLGAGQSRGIALVFLAAGAIMVLAALAAFLTPVYRRVSAAYAAEVASDSDAVTDGRASESRTED